jgi:tetratricopeptide (TPR) repeat protein
MRRWLLAALAVGLGLVSHAGAAVREGDGQLDPKAEVRHELQWTDVAPAPEPKGMPLLQVPDRPPPGVLAAWPPVDRPALRSLLQGRRYQRLTEVIEAFQAAFEADPRREDWMSDAYDVLAYAHSRDRLLLEEWIAATPRSFAPWLARAVYWYRSAYLWRGEKLARETTRLEFASMRSALVRARADAQKALSLRPGLVEARALLVRVDVLDGDRASAERTLREALVRCPTCFDVRTAWLTALEPRWGGSMEEMEAFAAAGLAAGPRLAHLAGYVDAERARQALVGGDRPGAVAHLDRACRHAEWGFLVSRADTRGGQDVDAYLADLDRADALRPGLSEVLSRRASARAHQQRWEEAGRDLLVVLRSRPTSRIGNWLQPRAVTALDALAWKEHEAGRDAAAARLYALVRALAPADARIAERAAAVGRGPAGADVGAPAAPVSGDGRPLVKVTVVDAAGKPVRAARVMVARGPGLGADLDRIATSTPAGLTGDDGRVAIPADVGPVTVMALRSAEHVGAVARANVVITGCEVRLVVGGPRRITGRVLEGERPVAGLEVRAVPLPAPGGLGDAPRSLSVAVTGADGGFAVEGLDAGGYVLHARGAGRRGSHLASGSATAGSELVIRVTRDRIVRGRVLVTGAEGGAGRPPERFKVRYLGEQTFSTPDGTFSLVALQGASQVVAAFVVEGRPPVLRRVELRGDETDAGDVVIGPGRVLRGQVTDRDGAPLYGARIRLEDGTVAGRSLADGSFEARIPDGTAAVEIEHAQGLTEKRTVRPDEDRIAVALSAGARVRILVTGPGGVPIPRVNVLTARAAGSGTARGCTTDQTGRCEIAGLETAEYLVKVTGRIGAAGQGPTPEAARVRLSDGEVGGVHIKWAQPEP